MSPCAATSGGFVLRRFPSGFFCCVLAGALVCVVAAAGAGCSLLVQCVKAELPLRGHDM